MRRFLNEFVASTEIIEAESSALPFLAPMLSLSLGLLATMGRVPAASMSTTFLAAVFFSITCSCCIDDSAASCSFCMASRALSFSWASSVFSLAARVA